MKTTLRLAALAMTLTLAPAAFADEGPLSGMLDASAIAVDAPTLEQTAAPTASVPEPAAIAPIAGAIIVALRRRRAA